MNPDTEDKKQYREVFVLNKSNDIITVQYKQPDSGTCIFAEKSKKLQHNTHTSILLPLYPASIDISKNLLCRITITSKKDNELFIIKLDENNQLSIETVPAPD